MANWGTEIHLLNILLMAISLLVAIWLPFELFIFVYAFIGPLHYITEINWLKRNDFFIKDRGQVWILVFLSLVVSIPVSLIALAGHFGELKFANKIYEFIEGYFGSIVFISLIAAIGLIYTKKKSVLFILTILGVLIAGFLNEGSFYILITALLIPSVIHVYFFTLIFMAYGLTKTKSRAGLIELMALVLLPLIIVLIPIKSIDFVNGARTLDIINQGGFQRVNLAIGEILGLAQIEINELNHVSSVAVKIQIFLSFAYLYHYLNWFSKISIIGWLKNTSSNKIIFMTILWIGSVVLYIYNFRLGLSLLFIMSFMHVVLEFPLNLLSMRSLLIYVKGFFR